MPGKFQNEATAWQRDRDRYFSGKWSLEILLEVSIWRAWNNVDIARRPRGKGSYAGAQNQQKRVWRTIVARKVADGGLDPFDLAVSVAVKNWLDEHGYQHKPERDTSGGEDSVEFEGTTIEPLWPASNSPTNPPERLRMPAILSKNKSKAQNKVTTNTAA